jgi:hypothetical protein
MADQQDDPASPAGMADVDFSEAHLAQRQAEIHANLEQGFKAEADVFAALGANEASGNAVAEMERETTLERHASAASADYAAAGREWQTVDHDLNEEARLTGEMLVAGTGQKRAENLLSHPEGLTEAQQTAIALEAARDRATMPVYADRAGHFDGEATDHAVKAQDLEIKAANERRGVDGG